MDLYAQWRLYCRWSGAPAAVEGLVHKGAPQALITAGTVTAGTPYYYVTQEEISANTAYELFWPASGKPGSFSSGIPTGTDVGVYYVWYAIGGGNNDTAEGVAAFDFMPECLTVTIGHNWEWVTDMAAACKDTGLAHQKCKNCDAVLNENTVLEVTDDHVYGDDDWTEATFADCGDEGYTGDEFCSVCGARLSEGEIIQPTGANQTELRGAKAATATEDGCTGDEVCTVCGQTIKTGEVIPATGEVTPDDPAEPEEPAEEGTCSVCGATHKKGTLDRLVGVIHRLIALIRSLFSGASSIC